MLEFFYLGDIGRHGRHFALGDKIGRHLGDITIYGMDSDVIKRFDWLIVVEGKFGGKNDSGIPEMEYGN